MINCRGAAHEEPPMQRVLRQECKKCLLGWGRDVVAAELSQSFCNGNVFLPFFWGGFFFPVRSENTSHGWLFSEQISVRP